MANASKRRPWVVEVRPPGVTGWYHLDAYVDADEAKAQCVLKHKRDPKAEFRYRDVRIADAIKGKR